MTEDEFEAVTNQVIEEADAMMATARQDAEAMLAMLPALEKLEMLEEKDERYGFAFQFMRAMEEIQKKANPFSLIELVLIVMSDTNSAKALIRHAPHRQAKAFVIAEWSLHRAAYENNKSAFSRDYVKRVKNEMSLNITEKQIREVWLKDTPPASKPDGLPARG